MTLIAIAALYVASALLNAYVMGWTRASRREMFQRQFSAEYPGLGQDREYVEKAFWRFGSGDEGAKTFWTTIAGPLGLLIFGLATGIRHVGQLGEQSWALDRQRRADKLSAEAEVDRIIKEVGL